MWGDLPAWGYYMRHVDGVTFTNCTSRLNGTDVRQEKVTNDVIPAPIIRTDTDSDGMPNDWEQTYFASTTAGSPTADDDGDGMRNYGEFVSGTNPTDPSDNLAPVSTTFDGSMFTVTFRSVPLKRYIAEYSDDLMSGTWTQLGNIRAANSNALAVTDTPPLNVLRRVYRLKPIID